MAGRTDLSPTDLAALRHLLRPEDLADDARHVRTRHVASAGGGSWMYRAPAPAGRWYDTRGWGFAVVAEVATATGTAAQVRAAGGWALSWAPILAWLDALPEDVRVEARELQRDRIARSRWERETRVPLGRFGVNGHLPRPSDEQRDDDLVHGRELTARADALMDRVLGPSLWDPFAHSEPEPEAPATPTPPPVPAAPISAEGDVQLDLFANLT